MTAFRSLPQVFEKRARAVAVSLVFGPAIWCLVYLSGQDFSLLLLAGLPLAGGAALLCNRIKGELGDACIATLLIVQAMLLTVHFANHPWQADSHTVFFVLLAIVSTLGSLRVLIWSCALISVYFLGAAMFSPGLAWPSAVGGAPAIRAFLHIALVGLEGGVLAAAMIQRHHARGVLAQTTARLETEIRMAADAQAEAEAAQKAAQDVINKMRIALTRLNGRDMTCAIDTAFPPAYEIMRQEFNETVETLRESFLNASALAASFTEDAQVLAREMITLAGQSDQQAERLAEMTQSADRLMEAFGTTVAQTAEAATATGEARKSAQRIEEVTTQAISAMQGIEGSSREISQIVDLIDDVAFQTNLLALNAGVEAARAGHSGKGFAVVATEVRHLAKSTSDAAANIRKLIRHSGQQVSTGADLVNAVGRSVSEILSQVSRASALTATVSAQNTDQETGLKSLHKQIAQADQNAEQTAESGRALAARSRKMTVGSKKLSCDIEAFTFTQEDLMRETSRS